MAPRSIYRFLQLTNLDDDLKEQVRNRSLSYRNALEQQAERNRIKKQQNKNKQSMKSIRLPNKKDIEPLQQQYCSAPNLMKLFLLVQHTYQTTQQMKDKALEFDNFELEYLYIFIQQVETISAYYQELVTQLIQTQERKINELAKKE